MEPMAVSNPSSPSSPTANASFLPSFLMGEPTQSPNMSGISPEKHVSFSPFVEPRPRQKLFNTTLGESINDISFERGVRRPGPPKVGLFDTFDPNALHNKSSNVLPNESMHGSFNDSVHQAHPATHNQSGAMNRSDLDHSRHETSEGVWITVFGFPSTCVSVILARFLQCGTILEKKFPAQGNWMHLRFATAQEAAKAVALNGKLVNSGLMVGVTPYQEQNYHEANKENFTLSYASPSRARSLRHSFVSPQRSDLVIAPQNVPQKSTGIVTKAMEYVFGW